MMREVDEKLSIKELGPNGSFIYNYTYERMRGSWTNSRLERMLHSGFLQSLAGHLDMQTLFCLLASCLHCYNNRESCRGKKETE